MEAILSFKKDSGRASGRGDELVDAFNEWSGHGEAYFTEMLQHLRR